MTTYPDPSDHPSFYDPEHPANRPACYVPRDTQFWVELLCDDGEQYGWGGWAFDELRATDNAWAQALEDGRKPVQTISCEVQS